MKKRIISLAATFALALSLTVTAYAGTVDQDSTTNTATTTITTTTDPTYTVTIPADTEIPFEATSTDLGSVELTSARLESGYAVTVSASAGSFKNDYDSAETIAYTLNSEGSAFTSAAFTAAGDSADLTIDIEQAAWDSAAAGSYTGEITFTVSYAMQ